MTLAIYKYALTPGEDGACAIEMPIAPILHVDVQRDQICLWAMNLGGPVTRTFWVFGTGHEIPGDLSIEHRGTVLMYGGSLVLHVFEELGNG